MDANKYLSVGILDAAAQEGGLPHRITSGAVMFIVSGTAAVAVNLDTHAVSSRDVMTMVRGGTLMVNSPSEDFRAYLIVFSSHLVRDADLLHNMMDAFGVMALNPVIGTSPEKSEIIERYCTLIYDTFTVKTLTFRAEIMKNIFEALLFAVNGLYCDKFGVQTTGGAKSGKKSLRSDDLLKRFMTYVAGNYHCRRDVAFYAGELCVTPKYLAHAVKTASGELPAAMISNAVIMDAKSKLKSTAMSVGEISDSLNFPNPSFFCKYFRKHTGTTPGKYRSSFIGTPDGSDGD